MMFNCVILKHYNNVIGIFPSIESAEYHRDMWKQHPNVDQTNWFCDWSYIPNLPF